MKTKNNKFSKGIFLALAVVLLSSCNRGTGCPSSFDIQPIFSFFGF